MNIEAAVQEYQTVNLSQLFESPTNPRKTFNEDALNELAKSIKAQGLLQPVLCRPAAEEGRFEIVVGARRYRASVRAEIEAIPIRVREMTDAQVLEAQVVENLIRADVHPYEETQGFLALMRLDPILYTPQELAAKTGKSVTFVVQRLKLADLIPAAAERLKNDEIPIGHALLLARLSPQQQEHALTRCFKEIYINGQTVKRVVTIAELSDYIDRNIILELSEAPFDREDESLHPEAGACLNCPKRSGFNTYLFPDVKQDSCFDAECYQEKVTRFINSSNLVQLAGDYQPVPEGSPIVSRHDYVEVTDEPETQCPNAVKGIVSIGNNLGAIKHVCVTPDCEVHHPDHSQDDESEDTENASGRIDYQALRRREFRIADQTAVELRKEITKKVPAIPAPKEMELLACMIALVIEDSAPDLLEIWNIPQPEGEAQADTDETELVLAHLSSLSGKPLAAAILEMLLFAGGCSGPGWEASATATKAAQHFRVDINKVKERVRRKIEAEEATQQPDEAATAASSDAAVEAEATEKPAKVAAAPKKAKKTPPKGKPSPAKAKAKSGAGKGTKAKAEAPPVPVKAAKRSRKA